MSSIATPFADGVLVNDGPPKVAPPWKRAAMSTLPARSMLIEFTVAPPEPAIGRTHRSAPAPVYLATKPSHSPCAVTDVVPKVVVL
jgi:hypothetical protein